MVQMLAVLIMLVFGSTAKSNESASDLSLAPKPAPMGQKVLGEAESHSKATQLGSSKFIVIGKLGEPYSHRLFLQDFKINGESFIPLFSSDREFRRQTAGSGFEGNGIEIDRGLLVSILRGDELLVLDPGGPGPIRLRREDLM